MHEKKWKEDKTKELTNGNIGKSNAWNGEQVVVGKDFKEKIMLEKEIGR